MIRGRTKLVCTIGPASADRVDELVAAGMDVARLNFSHGTDAGRVAAADAVRKAGNGRVALLADLPGPKIRLGSLVHDTVRLDAGAPFVLRAADGPPGDATGARVSYPRLAADVRPGDRILLADGAVEL
ncbi:MAG: pyruvate kinase, partial [Candidatus Limnocylindria bacterium]